MANIGAQPGNQNARKAKIWREAIMRALARKSGSVERGLDAAADKLASLAIDDGDKWAMEEIGNRLDGKVPQAIIGGDDDDPEIRIGIVERAIVRPKTPDTDR